MIPQTIIPDYTYPGQVFDELGSLGSVMPQYPALAYSLWTLPGSRNVANAAASAVMMSGITPYQGE